MNADHYIVEALATPVDASGRPFTRPATATGVKVVCVLCGRNSGYSRGFHVNPRHWLHGHLQHVRCSCGAVVTAGGFGGHKSAEARGHRSRLVRGVV